MSNMSGWARFGICCLLAVVILPEAVLGQCQIEGSSGPVTCATCDSTNTNCLSCFEGFQLDNSKSPVECVQCFEHCLQCTTTADNCTQCEPGYGVDPANVGTCGLCSTQNCEGICDANGPGKCDICSEGYGVGTSKLCEPCPAHCKTCGSRSTSYCDICDDGYTAEDGVCVVSSGSTTLRTTPGGGQSGSSGSAPTGGGASGPSTPVGGGGSSTQSGGGPGGSSTQSGGGPGGSSTQGGGGPGASTPGSGGPGASTPGSGGPGASSPGSGEPGASTPSGNGGGSGLSDGAKAGIIIGIVCGVLALLFLCLLSWLLCRWRPAGYVEERPQQVYQQQPMPYYTSTQQLPTRPSYYPWNRHFSQDHNHGDATHAHRARHLEFS